MTTQTLRAAFGALVIAAGSAGAQLPNASAAAFALGENYSAAARGADAAAWNPANLGLAGNPGFSLRALAGGGVSGLDPVTWSDFSSYGDGTIPRDVRLGWVDRVAAAGAQSGRADGGVTALAFSAGRLGVHIGASGYATASLSPDAVEALFFGNAGRSGTPHDLHLAGSSVRGGAFGTAAVSYAQPFATPNGRFSVGVTGKYIRGAGMLRAEDEGSNVTSNDVAVHFPIVHSQGAEAGAGYGVDLGAAYQSGALTLGARVENVVNTFAWDATSLRFRAGTASFDGTSSRSDFDEQPYAQAPQGLRDAVAAEQFAPVVGAGLAYRRSASLLITADARHQLGDANAIALGPTTRVGLGVESRALKVIPLRAGAAYVTGGWQASAGAGLKLGAFEIAGGYLVRQSDAGRGTGVMVNVVGVR